MPYLNEAEREVILKIVYAGPGLAGKTTNLKALHTQAHPDTRGRLLRLDAGPEHAMFFELRPVMLPEVRGHRICLHLHATPGALRDSPTRELLLETADGVIFVADSTPKRAGANEEALSRVLELRAEKKQGIPVCLQYNKRDLPRAATLLQMRVSLNPDGRWPEIAACARDPKDDGAQESLKWLVRAVLEGLRG